MKETIQIKLNKEDREKLIDEAKKKGHTISSFVRHLIKSFLANLR